MAKIQYNSHNMLNASKASYPFLMAKRMTWMGLHIRLYHQNPQPSHKSG